MSTPSKDFLMKTILAFLSFVAILGCGQSYAHELDVVKIVKECYMYIGITEVCIDNKIDLAIRNCENVKNRSSSVPCMQELGLLHSKITETWKFSHSKEGQNQLDEEAIMKRCSQINSNYILECIKLSTSFAHIRCRQYETISDAGDCKRALKLETTMKMKKFEIFAEKIRSERENKSQCPDGVNQVIGNKMATSISDISRGLQKPKEQPTNSETEVNTKGAQK